MALSLTGVVSSPVGLDLDYDTLYFQDIAVLLLFGGLCLEWVEFSDESLVFLFGTLEFALQNLYALPVVKNCLHFHLQLDILI
jgi:hypothetical protein